MPRLALASIPEEGKKEIQLHLALPLRTNRRFVPRAPFGAIRGKKGFAFGDQIFLPEQVPEQISDLYPLWGKGQADLYPKGVRLQIKDLYAAGTCSGPQSSGDVTLAYARARTNLRFVRGKKGLQIFDL